VVVLSGVAIAASAQQPDPPAALPVESDVSLTRAGHATRVELLGLVEVYTIALYVGTPVPDRAGLAHTETPKALRIEVRYEPEVFPRIPFDWRRELVPPLNPSAAAHLRGTFAPLKAGDVVVISYVPERGTTVRVNKGVAVSRGGHDLMMAFLDHWLGQTPVSEEIKHALSREP
jgi:hypothetical protein